MQYRELNEEDIHRIEGQGRRGRHYQDERPLTEDQINALWRYRLKAEDLPERLVKRARRKRDQKLEQKRQGKDIEEEKEKEEPAESLSNKTMNQKV